MEDCLMCWASKEWLRACMSGKLCHPASIECAVLVAVQGSWHALLLGAETLLGAPGPALPCNFPQCHTARARHR